MLIGETIYRFKYFPCKDYALRAIDKGTIKFSYPFTDFNDPFDCSPHVYIGSFDTFCREARKRGVKQTKQQARKNYDRAFGQVAKGIWAKESAPPFGVFCLTKNPRHLLMWAHYAENHKGFLIVFKYDRMMVIDGEETYPMPVLYEAERPSLSLWNSEAAVEKYNLTKGLDWSYEEEERAFVMGLPAGIYNYDRYHHLDSVVAGARIDKAFLEDLNAAVKSAEVELGKKIPLYRSKLSDMKYELEIPKFPY